MMLKTEIMFTTSEAKMEFSKLGSVNLLKMLNLRGWDIVQSPELKSIKARKSLEEFLAILC